MRSTALTLTAILLAAPALAASDDHSGHGTMDHGSMDHSTTDHSKSDHGSMDHSAMEGVHTSATINAIDGETWNVTHPPIPELRWPTMTMDLQLLDGAEVGDVKAGDEAMLMLEKGEGGMYGIRAAIPK